MMHGLLVACDESDSILCQLAQSTERGRSTFRMLKSDRTKTTICMPNRLKKTGKGKDLGEFGPETVALIPTLKFKNRVTRMKNVDKLSTVSPLLVRVRSSNATAGKPWFTLYPV